MYLVANLILMADVVGGPSVSVKGVASNNILAALTFRRVPILNPIVLMINVVSFTCSAILK